MISAADALLSRVSFSAASMHRASMTSGRFPHQVFQGCRPTRSVISSMERGKRSVRGWSAVSRRLMSRIKKTIFGLSPRCTVAADISMSDVVPRAIFQHRGVQLDGAGLPQVAQHYRQVDRGTPDPIVQCSPDYLFRGRYVHPLQKSGIHILDTPVAVHLHNGVRGQLEGVGELHFAGFGVAPAPERRIR